MTQLTVAEIRERKAEIEKQIAAILVEFEKETAVTIDRIEYCRPDPPGIISSRPSYPSVMVTARV